MVYKCCVPLCRGNYDNNGPKVNMFSFPAKQELAESWVKAIPRLGFTPTKYSRVCSVHFDASDIRWEAHCYDDKTGEKLTVRLQCPRLVEGAIPSIFPGCPAYLSSQSSSREAPTEKRERLDASLLNRAIKDSVQTQTEYNSNHMFSTFNEFVKCNRLHTVTSFWDIIERDNCIVYIHLKIDTTIELDYSVLIDDHLQLSVHYKGTQLKLLGKSFKFPLSVNNINSIHAVLDHIEHTEVVPSHCVSSMCDNIHEMLKSVEKNANDKVTMIQFIASQLQLFQHSKERFRYTTDTVIFSSLLYFLSPNAYRFIRQTGNLLLPHPVTIRKVCSSYNINPQLEQTEKNFLSYIKEKISTLQPHELYVTLMLDEIHIQRFVDYKGGNIVGMAHDSEKVANSAHVFMIQAIRSTFKDVVHIIPVHSLTADTLYSMIKKVILGLEIIGFKVICVITDNNSINRKAMSSFANPPKLSIVYPHPSDIARPLFYVVDPVHILKCIRNNWVNQRNVDHCMHFPDFDNIGPPNTASFSTLRKMYNYESNMLLKFGYGLSLKALWPSSMEKQNVKLALQVFNPNVVQGLSELGPKHDLTHYKGTSDFIKIVCTWWDIVNVKSPNKGKRLRNVMQEPMTNLVTDVKSLYLQQVLTWLDKWEGMKLTSGTLTKETHAALKLTTHALLEFTSYCIGELGMTYVLLGKVQTDALEARFGLYRQLAGAQYHISMRQVYEVENKLRLSSVMKLELSSGKSDNFVLNQLGTVTQWELLNETCDIGEFAEIIHVNETDIQNTEPELPVITYLSGYCAYIASKKLACSVCKEQLVVEKEMNNDTACRLIRNLDRGGLLYPQQIVVNTVIHNYVVVKKLISPEFEAKFSKVNSQRLLATAITSNLIMNTDILSTWDTCINNHFPEDVLNMIVWASTNTLLKNYCKLKNDMSCSGANIAKKRKLTTLVKK